MELPLQLLFWMNGLRKVNDYFNHLSNVSRNVVVLRYSNTCTYASTVKSWHFIIWLGSLPPLPLLSFEKRTQIWSYDFCQLMSKQDSILELPKLFRSLILNRSIVDDIHKRVAFTALITVASRGLILIETSINFSRFRKAIIWHMWYIEMRVHVKLVTVVLILWHTCSSLFKNSL